MRLSNKQTDAVMVAISLMDKHLKSHSQDNETYEALTTLIEMVNNSERTKLREKRKRDFYKDLANAPTITIDGTFFHNNR